MTTAQHALANHENTSAGRASVVALALLAPIGPLAVALLRYLLPYETVDGAGEIVREGYADRDAMSLVLWLSLVAALTIVPGAIAVGRLVRAAAPRLTTVALILTVPGYLMLPMLAVLDHLVWMAAEAGASQDSATALLEAAHPATAIATVIFVVGHVLGTVLLGVAMLRSALVPRWASIATIVSQPLHFVAAVIVPNHTLDGVAWGLNALGFAMVTVAVIRTTR
ncbi:MAG TPA: DUF4386 family protein [Nocardioides sp.]|nr:DUF4386 family protein [Nocardioides sp.]